MARTTEAESYRVERSVEIAAPPAAIHSHLVDFHRWTAWSPWEDLDLALTRTYSGPESGVGAVYEWSGNRKAGRGRMEITEATAPSALTVAVQFLKPFTSTSVASFALTPTTDGTRVTWSMVGRKTLMTKVMGVVTSMDKLIGPDFERGLGRLKALVEGATSP